MSAEKSTIRSRDGEIDEKVPFAPDASLKRPRVIDVFELRDMDLVSADIKRIVNLLTLKSETTPVGSFKYKIFKYPGDIDIFEMVKGCCTVHGVADSISTRIVNMIRRLELVDDVYFGDFKCGEDRRFKVNIGEIDVSGKDTKIKGYNQSKVKDDIIKLYDQKLLSKTEAQTLIRLARPEPINVGHWETLNDAFREFYVLRWSEDELLASEKSLRGDESISLSEAIIQGTVVKIDVWAPVQNRYIEVTNFFAFVVEEDGRKQFLTQKLGNYKASVFEDLVKYGSPEHRNSLKMAKRLWLIAAMLNDQRLGKILAPLFISPAAAISQVISESEVVRLILEKVEHPPVDVLMFQILGFEKRLKNNLPRRFENIVNNRVDVIYNLFTKDEWRGKKARRMVVQQLESLERELRPLIEEYSFLYLRKYRLNPADPKDGIKQGSRLTAILKRL